VTWTICTMTPDIEELPLHKLYADVFEDYSYNNDIYAKISFHVILGQLIKQLKIAKKNIILDSRFSIFLMQPSGTGKSTAYDYIHDICNHLGLNVMSVVETSDAALVGTIEEDMEVVDGVRVVDHTIKYGLLKEADIVHYDEASQILRAKEYSKSTLSYFQTALNPLDSPTNVISKKLAHGPQIEVAPTCSFLLTSFIPENVVKLIVTTGFFQRLLTVVRRVPTQQRIDNSKKDIEYLGINVDNRDRISVIVDRLEEVRKFGKEVDKITIPHNIRPALWGRVNDLYRTISVPNQSISDILNTFVPRYQDHMYRLAVHSAVMNFRSKLTVQDIRYAFNIIHPTFDLMVGWLESDDSLSKTSKGDAQRFKQFCRIFKDSPKMLNDTYISTPAFRNVVREKLGISDSSVKRLIKRFDEEGLLIRKRKGRTWWITIPRMLPRKHKEKFEKRE